VPGASDLRPYDRTEKKNALLDLSFI